MSPSRARALAWGVTGLAVATILWGALVRATGSGAGCGGHWPTCDGELLLLPRTQAMWFELPHRLTSGVLLLAVIGLALAAMRVFPRGHMARRAASGAVVVALLEALLGAGLVLFGLVGDDDSTPRAVAIAVHLTNTLLLLATLTLAAWGASGAGPVRVRNAGWRGVAVLAALAGVVLMGATGAVTALGDTLFPARDLLSAARADLSPTAHVLMRMRLLHPLVALSVGVYLLVVAGAVGEAVDRARRAATFVAGAVIIQIAIGFASLAMLAPIYLQIMHLLAADVLWIALVVMSAAVWFERGCVAAGEGARAPRTGAGGDARTPRARPRDYVALTKPRIISLLLFTTIAAMFVAARGWPGGWLLFATALGGYMAAGAANAINMVIDRDIDARMGRTSTRPTVTRAVSPSEALAFAMSLAGAAFALLWVGANLLTACLSMAGLVYYVLVYTIWLKRRSWHNIVIGGAAGAVPPLVGWAAVTGELNLLAWCLFAVIFAWTPVHFWALAMVIKEDYATAGVPMLPVVRGDRATVFQIGLYAALTAGVSVLPFLQQQVGASYLVCAVGLNVVLLSRSFRLYRRPERQSARQLFKFSLAYLALIFLALAIDQSTVGSTATLISRSYLGIG